MREIRLNGRELMGLSDTILASGGSLRFRARGFSMNPLIKDGDTIVVRPADTGDLHVGTVAFYRSASGKPVAHRIIGFKTSPGDCRSLLRAKDRKYAVVAQPAAPFVGKGNLGFQGNNGTSPDLTAVGTNSRRINCCGDILVRGDAPNSRTELVEPGQALGVVAAVERGAEIRRLDSVRWKAAGLLIAKFPWLGPCFDSPKEPARKIAAVMFHLMQRSGSYRVLAGRIIGRSVCYRVATVDDAAELAAFYQCDRFGDIADPVGQIVRNLRQLDEYGNYLCAIVRGKMVGVAVVRHFPRHETRHPDWWLFGLGVRTIVRGAGVGEGLVRFALETARRRGASRVHLLVDENNKVALSLYGKMGFVPTSDPALQTSTDGGADLANVRQIVLVKQVAHDSAQESGADPGNHDPLL